MIWTVFVLLLLDFAAHLDLCRSASLPCMQGCDFRVVRHMHSPDACL